MRRWITVICALAAWASSSHAQAPDGARARTLQYRWVVRELLTTNGYLDAATGRRYVLGDTVLQIDDVERTDVRAIPGAGTNGWTVLVRLTPGAARAFAIATAAHVGDMIAVLMDDRIVATATVESALGSVVAVVNDVSRATADSIALRINTARADTLTHFRRD